MAELVDALASGASDLQQVMGVRVSLWAQSMKRTRWILLSLIFFVAAGLLALVSTITRSGTSNDFREWYRMCDSVPDQDKEECFVKLVRKLAVSDSYPAIYDLYTRYATSADVECHFFAHVVGRLAQEKVGMNIDHIASRDPRILRYCGWGFWHGYISSLVENAAFSPMDLREFCHGIAKTYDAESDCFHGVGIGVIGDPPAISYWGKPDELLAKSFALCDQIATAEHLEQCYQGSFHQMIDYMSKGSFNFSFADPDNSFEFCFSQSSTYQHACFMQMAPGAYARSGGTVFRSTSLLTALRTLPYYPGIITAMIAGAANASGTDGILSSLYTECRDHTGEDAACVEGILIGVMGKGDQTERKSFLLTWCDSLDHMATHCRQNL